MKPISSALVPRTAFHQGTAMLWSRTMIARAASENTVSPKPTHTFSRQSRARMPTSSTPLPTTRIMNAEKKFDSAVTSPSMRSISSPGVVDLWKPMSRCRT